MKTNTNSHIPKAIIDKNFTEASVAQSMLNAAKSKIDSAQKQLRCIQEKWICVNDKKRELINNYEKKLKS